MNASETPCLCCKMLPERCAHSFLVAVCKVNEGGGSGQPSGLIDGPPLYSGGRLPSLGLGLGLSSALFVRKKEDTSPFHLSILAVL